MANTIDVTENGSNRKLTLIVSAIMSMEHLTYSNGVRVTVITLLNEEVIHVTQPLEYLKEQINQA